MVKSVKAIAFDFDGVFVRDSDAVFKKEAWKKVLSPYTGRYEYLLEEGNTMYGFGKSGGRMAILRYIFLGLGEPVDTIDGLVMQAAKTFDDYVQAKIIEAGLVPGAMEALVDLSTRNVSLYLNSSTVTSALATSARNLKINHFFRDILGSTKEPIGGSKTDNILFIVKQESIDLSEILVVGDGDSDVSAAKEVGSRFVGVSNIWNRWGETEKPFPLVINLRQITKYI